MTCRQYSLHDLVAPAWSEKTNAFVSRNGKHFFKHMLELPTFFSAIVKLSVFVCKTKDYFSDAKVIKWWNFQT